MGLFRLPAVRRIEAGGIWECTGETKPDEFPTFEVTEIVVKPAYNCQGMHDWVGACSKLEHFEVKVEVSKDDVWDYVFKPHKFRESLISAKDTLKTLSIEFDDEYRHEMVWARRGRRLDATLTHNHPFGLLKEFHVLENVNMRHANLVGLPNHKKGVNADACTRKFLVDVLPNSLRSLTITEISFENLPNLISDLEMLLSLKNNEMPGLKCIMLWVLTKAKEETRMLLDNLGLVAQGMGVHLAYELTVLYPST